MNRPCEHIIETLITGQALDAAGQSHSETCPECAEMVCLPGLVGQAACAVEVGPGFSSRMMARASERMIVRHRWRVAGGAMAVAAAALVAMALGTWLPGALSSSDRDHVATAERSSVDEPAIERDSEPDADEAIAPEAEDDLRALAEVPRVDEALAFRADWGAAGGHVDAADIIRHGARLDLTPRQRAALERIVAEQQKAEIRLRADIDVARVDLRNAIDAAEPDENKVSGLIDRVSQLEAQVRKKRVLAWLRARKVLTARQRGYLANDERRRPPGPQPFHADSALDVDVPAPRHGNQEPGDHDIDIHIDGLDELEIDLDGIPEALDMPEVDREVRDAMRRARDELRAAKKQMQEELARAHKELERAHELSAREREQLERAHHDLMREAEKVRTRAMREAEKARARAMRGAEKARARAMREAGKDARRAHRDAMRQALEAKRHALQQLKEELEREQRELEHEFDIVPPAPVPPVAPVPSRRP